MNHLISAYTPLESLFLFQSLLTHGVDNVGFARVSELLRNNPLIKEADTYDPTRLSPEALQHLFLTLFGHELTTETERAEATGNSSSNNNNNNNNDRSGSPASKKRKLSSPSSLPTLKDVYEHVEKIPALVERLYARYRDHIVKQIRDDERRFEAVQKDIQLLEKNERERRARVAASQNGAPPVLAPAPREAKASTPANGSTPSPVPTTPGTAYPAGLKGRPTSQTPLVPPKPPTPQVASPTVAPPSHLPAGTPPVRPSPSPKPANGAASVLQAPAGVPQSGPRPLQPPPPPQPPRQAISPRPEVGIKPKDAAGPQQTAAQGTGSLKWEKPYQPPQAIQAPPTRQFNSPVPPNQNVQLAPSPQPQPQPPQQQQQQQQQQQHHHPQPHPPQQHWYPQQTQGQPHPQHTQHPQHPQHPQHQPLPQQAQYPQHPQPPHTHQLIQSRPPAGKPVLVPPQNVGQVAPPLQPAPPRPIPDGPGVQAPQVRLPSASMAPPSRPIQPPQLQTQQIHQPQQIHRPIASAPPASPAGTTGPIAPPPQRWLQAYQQQQQQQPSQAQPQSASPTPLSSQKDKPYTSPYVAQAPRPAIPDHIIRQVVSTPGPKRTSNPPSQPQTPVSSGPALLFHGFGTRWSTQSTPSTPGPLNAEPESPAFEPMSPPQRPATLNSSTPKPPPKRQASRANVKAETPTPTTAPRTGRGRALRTSHASRGVSATPSATGSRRSQSVASHKDELAMDQSELAPIVKNEDVTPKPMEDTGDTTADESVASKPHIFTPASISSRVYKRKRQETPPEEPPPTTHVLWTRGFTKVSSSALDQISSHRDANMFATALREKDAPNYRQIVLQPQDITSIRAAIKHGNKAAVQAAAALPGGDPGTANVWLPTSEELVPPKGIINSAQLERELVHMFCNAIMYNPDPDRGPGPHFIKRPEDEEGVNVGYRLDENGVVKNTRSMFVEVEKLLGDLRSAEKERSAPPPSATRPASVATPADDTGAEEEDELAGDGEMSSGMVKRRRIGTRG